MKLLIRVVRWPDGLFADVVSPNPDGGDPIEWMVCGPFANREFACLYALAHIRAYGHDPYFARPADRALTSEWN